MRHPLRRAGVEAGCRGVGRRSARQPHLDGWRRGARRRDRDRVRARPEPRAVRYQPRRRQPAKPRDQQPPPRSGPAGRAMTWLLSRLSIRQKLAALLMLTSSIVLVVASISYLTWDYFRFRADMLTVLSTQAGLV